MQNAEEREDTTVTHLKACKNPSPPPPPPPLYGYGMLESREGRDQGLGPDYSPGKVSVVWCSMSFIFFMAALANICR